jgi:hypothetical protein
MISNVLAYLAKMRTADYDIFRPIQDLHLSVRMPHGQISGMAHAARPQLARCLRVAVVAPRADVAREHNLANLLAVFGYVHYLAFRQPLLNHSYTLGRYKPVTLACHVAVALFVWHIVPRWLVVAFRDGAVSFRQAVNVNRVEVQPAHLLEQVRCRRACGDRDSHWLLEPLGILISA